MKKPSKYFLQWDLLRPYLGLVLVFLLACLISPEDFKGGTIFLRMDNLLDIVRNVSVRGILAIGMTFVIISGGIDLSVGSVLSLSTVLTALSLSVWGLNPFWAILLGSGVGLLTGFVNGLTIAKAHIQSFVVTLAMMSIARGLAMAVSHNNTIAIGFDETGFLWLEEMLFGFLPMPALIFVALVIFFQILLVYTAYGRNLYAIGGNEVAARLAGVNVDRLKVVTFTLCGFLAAAAGVLQSAQMHQGDPKEGVAFELDAIAAVVVGGASLNGGSGNVVGTLVGALLIGIITNILGLKNVEPSVQKIVIGLILIFAVMLQTGTFHRIGRKLMKSPRRTGVTLALIASLTLFAGLLTGCSSNNDSTDTTADSAPRKYRIGFSQPNNAEPWRQALVDAAKREAAKHPDTLEVLYQDAEQKNDQQVQQVKLLDRQGIDMLIISPNEAAPLTPVIEEVYDKGIPVIILDRATLSDKYTCFIGADNREIGKKAGEYAAQRLNGKGKIVEIKGLPGSIPAIERSESFREAIAAHSEIQIVHEPVANWLQREAIDQMKMALQAQPEINLVYGHNDPMAIGAYISAKQAGREKEMKFIGIDALPNEGVKAVMDGVLDATLWYPTCGQEAIQYAVKIMNGEQVPKKVTLETALITKENAQEWMDKLTGKAPAE